MHHHRQIGTVTLAASLAASGMTLAWALRSHYSAVIARVLLFLLPSLLFSSLTIEVDRTEVRHYCGPRFWLKRVALESISAVGEKRSSWYECYGIRVTAEGMLYSVAGFRVVEIRLRSGVRFRLGTDDPAALVAAIRAGIGAPPV